MTSNKEVYILVIIASIVIYGTKTRILYENKYGECSERSFEGVTLTQRDQITQFFIPNIILCNFLYNSAETFLKKI